MSKKYYEFEVELAGSRPRIWRRFYLESSATFGALHDAIQAAFEWGGHHLYEFREPGRRGEGLCGHEVMVEEGIPAAIGFKLKRFFGDSTSALKARGCLYLYDFGDGWEHRVKLKRVVELDEVFTRRLVAGASASALDDCGGIWGYQQLLAEAADGDEEARELLSYRPAEFVFDQMQEWFDIPKKRAAAKTRQASASRPVVAALPSQAMGEEVAALLMARLSGDASLARVIAWAAARWAELIKRELPEHKPALWAAALEYAAVRELGEARLQSAIAQAYGVSVAMVSKLWPQVTALLKEPAPVVEPVKPAPAEEPARSAAAEIEAQLIDALEQDDIGDDEIERACELWRGFVAASGALTRRAVTYVAAMEYLVRMTSDDRSLQCYQADLADAYGVSAQTISSTAKQIAGVLGIELEITRGYWEPGFDMLEAIRQMMGALSDEPSAPRVLMWEDEELEALRGLRRDEEEVWELDVSVVDGEALCFWGSRRDLLLLGVSSVEFEGATLRGDVLLATLAQAWLSHPAKVLPGVLVCQQPQNAQLLEPAMAALGIEMRVERLTNVPRIRTSFTRRGFMERVAGTGFREVEDSALELFYRQGYRLWEAAPWRQAVGAQLIEVRDKKHMRCLSVPGEQREVCGLILYDNVRDWEEVVRAGSIGEGIKTSALMLEFVYGFGLPEEEHERVARSGLPVARLDAYPVLSRWTKHGPSGARASDYALMSKVMEGLLMMLSERPELFEERFDKHVTTAAGLTFVAPHAAARRRWAQLGLVGHAWA